MRALALVVAGMLLVGCGRLHFDWSQSADAGGGGTSGTGTDAGMTDAALIDAGAALDAAGTDATLTSCGNGTIEPPEECDDSGESATCDSDCTFAACGDNTLNITAGEGCDDSATPTLCGLSCQPPTCRAGCTCEWYRGTRYMLCAEVLDRDAAQVACATESMRLVRIDSATEQTWLRRRTVQAGFPKFHLGASDSAVEGTWVWDDGTEFWQGVASGTPIGGAFSAWAPGEPNSFVVEENCSEVQSVRGWNDCVCDLAKPVVCKDYPVALPSCGNGVVEIGEACDTSGESATCDADCSAALCGDGVVNRARGEICDDRNTSDYCDNGCTSVRCPVGCSCFDANGKGFALCPATATFRDAGVLCGRVGMTLARVYDATADQQLRSRATTAGIGDLWVGAFDIDQADSWVWSDLTPLWTGTATGTAHAYENFTTGAPSGAMNSDCLTILPNGEWQDVDCTVPRAYACERL